MRRFLFTVVILVLSVSGLRAEVFDGSDQFKQHLEFLGYEVTEKKKALQAKHGTYLNVWIKSYQKGILLIGYFGRSDDSRSDTAGFHAMINDLNKDAAAARYYEDKDGDLAIEAWFPGGYDRVRFGVFMDSFNQTRSQLQKESRLERYVK